MFIGFIDADWARDVDERKSTIGYTFNLSSEVISWESKRKPYIAPSTTKLEYKPVVGATCKVVWLRRILRDLKLPQMKPIVLRCDNQSAIKMTKNLRWKNQYNRKHCLRICIKLLKKLL